MRPHELLRAEHDYKTRGRWGRCPACPGFDHAQPRSKIGPAACQHAERYDHRLGRDSLVRAAGNAIQGLERQDRVAEVHAIESLIQRVKGLP